MKVILGNNEYTYLTGYQKDNKLRTSFNNLSKKIFNLSFEDWYRTGYWNEKYIPYTLFDEGIAVANVSINIMNFNTFGQKQQYIQLGTVMTDESYRNKNLSKFLMEKILEEWGKKCNFIYLYANKTVLNFYPKFGFKSVNEYEYFKPAEKNIGSENFEKLNMDIQSNRDKLHDYVKTSNAFSKLSMKENADLVMFYCISFLKDNVYYIKKLDVIAVAQFKGNRLHLWDIFGKNDVELDQVVYSLVNSTIDEIVLGFTPKNCDSYDMRKTSGDDVLFIQEGRTELFDNNKVMFPLLSHA